MASYFRQAREWATPTLKSSAFLEKGVLTPEEFVAAGDELVYRCPTWSWERGLDTKLKPYLPPDKQYLITRNVPCPNRCAALEGEEFSFLQEEFGIEHDGDDNDNNNGGNNDDWLVSSKIDKSKQQKAKDEDNIIEDEFDILDEDGEIVAPTPAPAPAPANDANDADDDDEYGDMEDMIDDNILQDDDMAIAAVEGNNDNTTTNNVLKVRTYDLSITYDKYYQTPRMFLIGRNTNDQPLTATEMMQDVMSDYANKTVTMESHPHVSGPHASIHPCQHGKVMKAIVKNLIKNSSTSDGDDSAKHKPPSVELYLFIFLKFVSSMIPTINYDFTMEVQADTSK